MKTCNMKWYPYVLTACQLVLCDLEGEERRAENMDVSDGLLLQVNNGEQWCNRWKHPSDDSVSNRSTVCLHMPSYCRISITPFFRSLVFLPCLSMHVFHKTGGFMCVSFLYLQWLLCVSRTAVPAPQSYAALPARGKRACWTERGPL